jgi:cell division transport system permease protein
MRLAASGGLAGGLLAVPTLLALAAFAAPFADNAKPAVTVQDLFAALPVPLWGSIAALPVAAAAIGFVTAQMTVRRWLRHLP